MVFESLNFWVFLFKQFVFFCTYVGCLVYSIPHGKTFLAYSFIWRSALSGPFRRRCAWAVNALGAKSFCIWPVFILLEPLRIFCLSPVFWGMCVFNSCAGYSTPSVWTLVSVTSGNKHVLFDYLSSPPLYFLNALSRTLNIQVLDFLAWHSNILMFLS